MQTWLMKSEEEVYSFANLRRDKKTLWEGVRNFQARNFMKEKMKIGDPVLFYHSNSDPTGVAGLAKVVGPPEPDPTAFDKSSDYYDAKSSPEKPLWYCVQVGYWKDFPNFVTLPELRSEPRLSELLILKRGNRLSITPVEYKHFLLICERGGLDLSLFK